MPGSRELAEVVKTLARRAGFDRAAIAPAEETPGLAGFTSWLRSGFCGEMSYLSRNVGKRFDPAKLFDQARSVICLAVGYAPGGQRDQRVAAGPAPRPFVARYARGRDYHKVLKKRCLRLMDDIRGVAPRLAGRALVDCAPVAERSLAARAGLGWIGKNGCLIVPGLGSYVVLAEIVTNLELSAGQPMDDRCGDCDACLRACPTGALLGGAIMDARRCLSYLTVEHRAVPAGEFWPLWGSRVFGCDTCQEACPHNRSLPAGDAELTGGGGFGGATIADVLSWGAHDWDAATRGSAVRRATLDMLLRSATIAAGCSGDGSLVEPLRRLRGTAPQLAGPIEWALGRIG